jgi:hypothetical protein
MMESVRKAKWLSSINLFITANSKIGMLCRNDILNDEKYKNPYLKK